jgi:hypothetical protein
MLSGVIELLLIITYMAAILIFGHFGYVPMMGFMGILQGFISTVSISTYSKQTFWTY